MSHFPATFSEPLSEKQLLARQQELRAQIEHQSHIYEQRYQEHLDELRDKMELVKPEAREQWLEDQAARFEIALGEEGYCALTPLYEELRDIALELAAISQESDSDLQPLAANSSSSPEPEKCAPSTLMDRGSLPEVPVDYLYGADTITRRGSKKKLRAQGGLIVVQFPEDVDRLAQAGLLSVGTIELQPTDDQLRQIVDLAEEYCEKKVLMMLPLTRDGRKAIWEVVQRLLPDAYVRVPVTSHSFDGAFTDCSPGSYTEQQITWLQKLLLCS